MTYLKRFLAGAIFGLYTAHLLYFLNPQIDITPARLVTVTLIYALIAGLLFGTALWLLHLLRVKAIGASQSGGDGFGFIVLAAFVAAALYWLHLSVFHVGLLPIGAVRVLSKATNLITSTAFALLLLWFVQRSRRSRVVFAIGLALIAISAFFLYQRRDRYRPEQQSVVVANMGMVAGERPVIVIAIRNLPYDWILTLTGEGSLPFFDQAKKSAYFTRLEPFPTLNPSALWASLATGKLPFRHGVTGRFAYRTAVNARSDPTDRFLIVPSAVAFRVWGLVPPIDRISAQLPAGDALPLWTLFQRVGLRASVIDWPGVAVAAPNVMPSAAVLQRFNGAGRARDRIVRGLAADLTATARIRVAASDRSNSLVIGALNGFEDAQRAIHIFTNDLPQRSAMKGEVLRAYAEQIDVMIASIARQFPDHLLVIVSPSGPVAQPLAATPYALARDWITTTDPGADDGFALIAGRGVAHPERPQSAEPEDVVPTVLYAAGLPVGRDMDGRVLTDAFTDEQLRGNPLSVVQTYEARQLVVRSHS